MRFQHPRAFESRTRSGFLWLPKQIDYETRWLERATWKEVYCPSLIKWLGTTWLEATVPHSERGS